MRILIVGSNKHMSIERHYVKYLTELGATVEIFASGDMAYGFYNASLFNKVLFKSGIWTSYKDINRKLISTAEAFKPDVIWVFKGMEIYPETLRELGKKIYLTNYNPDHPFIISSSGSGNKNVTESVGLYNLHFCYHTGLQKQIEENYHLPTVFLPFGFELSQENFQKACKAEEIKKVCFLGNPDTIRERTVALIAEAGFSIDVFGHGWYKTKVAQLDNVGVHDAVYGTEFWVKLRQYRVQLNIFRPHNVGSHNMRTFEIPAVGGIQLAPDSKEHRHFFEEGKDIFLYKNQYEMLDSISTLMNFKEIQTSFIRQNSRKKCIDADYTYKKNANIANKIFLNLLNNN